MRRFTAPVAAALLICGCVGPNFHRPTPPPANRYTEEPLPDSIASGDAPRFALMRDLPRKWWTVFGSDELDAMVDESFKANPDVASAQAALRQARENAAAQRGAYFPGALLSFDAGRHRDATGVVQPTLQSGTPVYSLFTPQVSVSYVPDVFGANRRAVEALVAQAEVSEWQLEATYLTLAANVVTAAIQEAGVRAQIASTDHSIELERESLAVLRRELELGAIAELDVMAQEAALAQLESSVPVLRKQLHQSRDQLATLTGRLPADFAAPHLELDALSLPTELPVGVPSQLVERRPDIRAAEAELHAATAQVGVAIANLLPQITLTGDLGSTATLIADLLKPGTRFWSAGANASQTLFAGGTLLHRKRAADAALDQAAAQYRAVVLTAFQNVADALHALQSDAEAANAASRAAEAAQRSLEVVRQQLDLGSVSYLSLVNAEQASAQALVSLAQARTNRLTDTAALYQALGGAVEH